MPFTTPIWITPTAENNWRTIWTVLEPLNFRSENTGKNYVVDAGFATDLASGFLTAASAAAIVHDWLYYHGRHYGQIENRAEADEIFFEAMLATGVPLWRAWAYFSAVRLFGWLVYKPEGKKKVKPLIYAALLAFLLSITGCSTYAGKYITATGAKASAFCSQGSGPPLAGGGVLSGAKVDKDFKGTVTVTPECGLSIVSQ